MGHKTVLAVVLLQ